MLLRCPLDLAQLARANFNRKEDSGPAMTQTASELPLYYFVLIELTRVLQTLVLRDL